MADLKWSIQNGDIEKVQSFVEKVSIEKWLYSSFQVAKIQGGFHFEVFIFEILHKAGLHSLEGNLFKEYWCQFQISKSR